MGGPRGDGSPRDRGAGREPEPSELWISGASEASGGSGPPGPAASGAEGTGPGEAGGPGWGGPEAARTGRRGPGHRRVPARWIALAAGFAVLVAVIALQHVAGGHPVAAPVSGSSTATSAPSPRAVSGHTGPTSAATSALSSVASSLPSSAPSPGAALRTAVVAPEPGGAATTTLGAAVSQSPGAPATTRTAPSTATAARQPDHLAGGWELIGYGTDGLVRYWPDTGKLVVTPIPDTVGFESVVELAATSSTAVVLSPGAISGYAIPAGKPAIALAGPILEGQAVLPGPDSDHLWVATYGRQSETLVPVDSRGDPSGTPLTLPSGLGSMYGVQPLPDGAGYALVRGIGGTYDVRPGGATLVTRGIVLAAGPTGYLVYECDTKARCATAVIDRRTGKRTPGPAIPAGALTPIQGTISPNGRYAAMVRIGNTGPEVEVLDLATGTTRDVSLDLGSFSSSGDSSSMLVFSPDSRYLFVASGSGVVHPVDTRTGQVLAPLDLPPMSVITVLPAH